MMTIFLSVLKYWKIAGVALLVIALTVSSYLAHHRGEALRAARQDLQTKEAQYRLTLKLLEDARKANRERMNFRTLQTRKFKEATHETLVLDPALRSAYDELRKRQASAAAR